MSSIATVACAHESTQCVPVLSLTHSWARGETQSVYMAKPEAGNGIARFSMWLRHRELLPSTVMSNRTVYAWNDNFAAAAEQTVAQAIQDRERTLAMEAEQLKSEALQFRDATVAEAQAYAAAPRGSALA